jgi:hypothetical protein
MAMARGAGSVERMAGGRAVYAVGSGEYHLLSSGEWRADK